MDPPAANGHSTSKANLKQFWEYQPLELGRLQERARFYAHKAGASTDITGLAPQPLMVHRGHTAPSDMQCSLQESHMMRLAASPTLNCCCTCRVGRVVEADCKLR